MMDATAFRSQRTTNRIVRMVDQTQKARELSVTPSWIAPLVYTPCHHHHQSANPEQFDGCSELTHGNTIAHDARLVCHCTSSFGSVTR